jgi:hypothetical protein
VVFWRVLTLGSVIAVGAVGGCNTAPKLEPKGKVIVPIQSGTQRIQAAAHLLNEIFVQLPPIAKAGEQWTIVFNDTRYLKQLGPIEPSAGGGFSVRFLAVHVGRRPIRFFALPPGREAEPSQIHEVVVEIE